MPDAYPRWDIDAERAEEAALAREAALSAPVEHPPGWQGYPEDDEPTAAPQEPTGPHAPLLQACPRCSSPMGGIKGSRDATCRRCGYKDDCC